MLYAYSLLFLIYSCLLSGIGKIYKAAKTGAVDNNGKNAIYVGAVLIGLSAIIALPVAMQIYYGYLYATGEAVSMDVSNTWHLIGSGLGCFIAVVIYGFDLRELANESKQGFLRIGRDAISIICACYIIFTIVDHFTFFGNAETAGVADLVNLHAFDQSLTDVECEQGAVVVSDFTATDVKYRCPMNIVWGGMVTATPFIPWPSYSEGHSKQLGIALRALLESAKKSRDQHAAAVKVEPRQ
jgi:hypothetical protein